MLVVVVLNRVLRWLGLERWFFTLLYLRGRPPWDTGQSPPELVDIIEGPDGLAPGYALDLGCGTGTNSLYLARHGWRVNGIDFAAPAIAQAEAKRDQAQREGAIPSGALRFVRGDATSLSANGITGPYTLLLDMGCLHGVMPEGQRRYAQGLAEVAAPQALYLLYAFAPGAGAGPAHGLTEDEVRALFAPTFQLEHVERGANRGGRPSAWYWLRRSASS